MHAQVPLSDTWQSLGVDREDVRHSSHIKYANENDIKFLSNIRGTQTER